MALAKAVKKSGRHNQNRQSARPQSSNSTPHHEEHIPLVTQANGDERENVHIAMPALLPGPRPDMPENAKRRPTPLALIPQRLPAVHEEMQRVDEIEMQEVEEIPAREPKRKRSTVAQALLISVCLIAALIFSLNALKTSRNETQVARAEPDATLVAPTSAPDTGGQTASKILSPTKEAAAPRTPRTEPKHAATANRQRPSAPRTEKKSSHARTEQATHPLAEKANKKPAPTIAKAAKKPREEHPAPLLAQNSTPPASQPIGSQNKYAQCQELESFFRREQCKWQVCNGKWGQDGCPSYSGDNRQLN